LPLARLRKPALFIRSVKVLLKPEEGVADQRYAAELRRGIVDRVVLELQQRAQFLLIKLAHTLRDILPKHEIKKRLKFPIVPRENVSSVGLDSLGTGDRRKRVSDTRDRGSSHRQPRN
jgi:hypothetical protein